MKAVAPFEPAIVASNMQSMLEFYRDILEMSVFSLDQIPADAARKARLSAGGYEIARLESSHGDRLKIVVPEERAASSEPRSFVLQRQGYSYLTFIVPDLAYIVRRLRQFDVELFTGDDMVAFRPGVVNLIFAKDPEGNFLEFVERNDLDVYRPLKGGNT